ncbi:MAG: tyrosine-type recombinase/integrase, partial [Polyangiaceae bacterium]|nr:tyrosine-type recombinase/integrase [Polyangiaceae bacterium]
MRLSLPGVGRRAFALPGRWTEATARSRLDLLSDLADRLAAARQIVVGLPLLERAAVSEGQILAGVRNAIDLLCRGEGGAKQTEATFADIANAWVSGELRKRYPDHVKPLEDVRKYRSNFDLYILPLVGQVPIRQFKIEHAELVMRNLPQRHSVGMRGKIALRINRVLGFAVYPLKLIESSPIPRGWAPKGDRGAKAYAYLYPDEDARLIGCTKIPLVFRVYYAFLCREGMRCDTEAGELEWSDIDFEHGVVRLDENKTKRPRAWKLSPDTLRALRLWRKLAPKGSFVFVGAAGGHLPGRSGAVDLRERLKIAGVKRPELFEHSTRRQRIRLHDLRATFV